MTQKYYYYFAYGMNTNAEQMKIRCPRSIPLGAAVLPNHRLDFKSHATVTVDKKNYVDGVLWMITEEDEDSLDILEGFPKYYLKKIVKVKHDGAVVDAMTYYIPGHEQVFPPGEYYYEMVLEGYRKFNVPTKQLYIARRKAEKHNFSNPWYDLVDSNFYL